MSINFRIFSAKLTNFLFFIRNIGTLSTGIALHPTLEGKTQIMQREQIHVGTLYLTKKQIILSANDQIDSCGVKRLFGGQFSNFLLLAKFIGTFWMCQQCTSFKIFSK